MASETYPHRKSQFLSSFKRSIERVHPVLIDRYGRQEADTLMRLSGQKYEDLIPQIPYIGDRNPMFNLFLLPASRYLAIYRAFQSHGRSLEETGRLVYEIGQAELLAIPGLVRWVISALWFSGLFRKRVQRRAALSQARKYPGDFVFVYTEPGNQEFDYGIDYLECAVCKFYRQQDAVALTPYICAIDKPASEMLGWGLYRMQALADGGEKCDFRFKKGGNTRVEIPL